MGVVPQSHPEFGLVPSSLGPSRDQDVSSGYGGSKNRAPRSPNFFALTKTKSEGSLLEVKAREKLHKDLN